MAETEPDPSAPIAPRVNRLQAWVHAERQSEISVACVGALMSGVALAAVVIFGFFFGRGLWRMLTGR